MSESQLREAFTLMKQGDKQGASRLVQSVLKEDRSNVNAWWLFANVLEDEEKVVKALEKVIALNPEHPGARKRLAQLRPEYAHLAAPSPEKEKAKQVADNVYKAPLKAKKGKQQSAGAAILMDFLSGLGFRALLFLVIMVPLVIIGIFAQQEKEATLPDTNGNTPQIIAEQFYDAMYSEDIDRMYELTCPARHNRIDEIVAGYNGIDPSTITVDLSDTNFYLSDYRGQNKAYVDISGVMIVNYPGSNYTLDWDADAESQGYDGYGIFFERIDGIWLVCNPYHISDMEFNDE